MKSPPRRFLRHCLAALASSPLRTCLRAVTGLLSQPPSPPAQSPALMGSSSLGERTTRASMVGDLGGRDGHDASGGGGHLHHLRPLLLPIPLRQALPRAAPTIGGGGGGDAGGGARPLGAARGSSSRVMASLTNQKMSSPIPSLINLKI